MARKNSSVKKRKARDKKLAKKSLHEEQMAITAYKERGKQAYSRHLKADFAHALGEEKTHAKLFKEHV
jgi:hypothetical protein